MALIDEKGRLFGKANIIDLAIVAFIVLAFLGGAYYVASLENESKPVFVELSIDSFHIQNSFLEKGIPLYVAGKQQITGYVVDYCSYPTLDGSLWLLANLSVVKKNASYYFQGKKLLIGNKIALDLESSKLGQLSVLSIGKKPRAKSVKLSLYCNAQGDNGIEQLRQMKELACGSRVLAKVLFADTVAVSEESTGIVIELNASAIKRNNQLFFMNKPVKKGEKISLAFPEQEPLECVITGINRKEAKAVKINITVLVEAIDDWLIAAVHKNDKELSLRGKVVAEIKNKKIVPYMVTTQSDSGEIFMRQHPILKSLELEIAVNAENHGSSFFYKGKRLRIGNSFYFQSGNYGFTGKIISIEK